MHKACTSIVVLAGALAGCSSQPRQDAVYSPASTRSMALGARTPADAGALSVPQFVASRINGHDLATVRDMCLSLGVTDGDAFSPPGMPPEYPRGPFSACVLPIEIDGLPGRGTAATVATLRAEGGGPDAIVRIGDPAGWDWRLLAFIDTAAGWKFAGSIDLPGYRFGAPAPQCITIGPGRSWLSIRTSDGESGAGFVDTFTTWYGVKDGALVEALHIPSGGYRSDGLRPFDITYTGEVVDTFLTSSNLPAVRVRYEAVYLNARQESMPGLKELFRKKGMVTYVQDAASGRFRMEPAGSPFTTSELESLLSATPDQFLRANADRLQDMTRSGDVRKRQWVGRLLLECADSEEKTALSDELDAAQGG